MRKIVFELNESTLLFFKCISPWSEWLMFRRKTSRHQTIRPSDQQTSDHQTSDQQTTSMTSDVTDSASDRRQTNHPQESSGIVWNFLELWTIWAFVKIEFQWDVQKAATFFSVLFSFYFLLLKHPPVFVHGVTFLLWSCHSDWEIWSQKLKTLASKWEYIAGKNNGECYTVKILNNTRSVFQMSFYIYVDERNDGYK